MIRRQKGKVKLMFMKYSLKIHFHDQLKSLSSLPLRNMKTGGKDKDPDNEAGYIYFIYKTIKT